LDGLWKRDKPRIHRLIVREIDVVWWDCKKHQAPYDHICFILHTPDAVLCPICREYFKKVGRDYVCTLCYQASVPEEDVEDLATEKWLDLILSASA